MFQVDQTGAGKTLFKLLSWWDRVMERTTTVESDRAQALLDFYKAEASTRYRLSTHAANIRYPFLNERLKDVIAGEDRILASLKNYLAELGVLEPETAADGVPDEFGLAFTEDLQRAHVLRNEYDRWAAQTEDGTFRLRFELLAREKESQIAVLADIAPKIHN